MTYDVFIIGKGPAGISAAVYSAMSGAKTVVAGMDDSALLKTEKIANYYGFSEPVNGKMLFENGIKQAENAGARVVSCEVLSVEGSKPFTIKTDSDEYSASTVIFAQGSRKKHSDVKNLDTLTGRGVSFCAVCDGFFFRGKNVAVLGAGEYALSEAIYLANIAKKVTVLTDGETPSADFSQFDTITEKIDTLTGADRLDGVLFTDGSRISTDGLFSAEGIASASQIGLTLGVISENGIIVTDKNRMTNVPGVFAAGDCADSFKQVSSAVHTGAAAGLAAAAFSRKIGEKINNPQQKKRIPGSAFETYRN